MEPFRIQPIDNDPPEKNPFEFDLLNREEAVETLTRLISTIEGPCVLAVDAPWGAGKTTFLKIWAQYLRNQHFFVVKFNAWETDFSDDPFVALCAELTRGFGEEEGGEYAKEFKKAAVKVIKHISSNAVEKVTGGLVVPTKLSAELKEKAVETATEERLAKHQQAQAVIKEFKEKLEDMARALNDRTAQADAGSQKPLVVMIDELDRCRPSYAVELLETAKHLFDVDRIVFVLAVNREQLAHAVRALYGTDFKAENYLRRFFDVDFRLPEPGRDRFIGTLLNSMGITDQNVRELLKIFLDVSALSLRDIAQAVHRFCLVSNAQDDNQDQTALWAAIVLIMRTLNEELYREFVNKEVTDILFAEEIFKITPLYLQQRTPQGIVFQTGLVQAYKEVLNKYDKTLLEVKIDGYISDNSTPDFNLQEVRRRVIQILQGGAGFMIAHQHIELLSSSFTKNHGTV